jgi:uncharacterized protein YciI
VIFHLEMCRVRHDNVPVAAPAGSGQGRIRVAGKEAVRGAVVDERVVSQPLHGTADGPGVPEGVPGRQQVRMFFVEFVFEPAEGSPALDGPCQPAPGTFIGKSFGEVGHVLVPDPRLRHPQRRQKWQDRGVSEWVFFMHPPRDDFIATMSGAERAAFDAHAAWLRKLLADGLLIAAGPCLGQVNTGLAIFEAASEEEARRITAGEPVTSGGYMRGDLRPFRLGMLRGRDGAARDRPVQPVSSQPAHHPGSGLPPLLALGQDRPDVSDTAFVAPGAMLIGRVTIGAEASVWRGGAARRP